MQYIVAENSNAKLSAALLKLASSCSQHARNVAFTSLQADKNSIHFAYKMRCCNRPRPFLCEEPGCGKSFTERHRLTRHAKTHEQPKPYTCTETDAATNAPCTAAFTKV
jgi:hypothetical protein